MKTSKAPNEASSWRAGQPLRRGHRINQHQRMFLLEYVANKGNIEGNSMSQS
jgi:hypothetical protein